MSRALNDLSAPMRLRAFEWLARLAEAGVMVMIVDTLRTQTEHQHNLTTGASKITTSYHLPRRLRVPGLSAAHPDFEKSDAIDICPYRQYSLHGSDKLQWDTKDPVWRVIIRTCEEAGLESGGRWANPHDPGHGQLPRRIWLPTYTT